MRSLLLASCLLLSAAASAQTAVPAPVLEGYRLVFAESIHAAESPGGLVGVPGSAGSDLGTGALTAVLSGTGGLVVGMVSVLGIYFLDDCSVFGCSEDSAVRGLYGPAWVAGGAAGTVATVWLLGRDAPFNPDVGRDDWKRALVGVAAGTLVGVALMTSVPGVDEPDGPLWPILAVPVLQGVGAGVAVGLR